MRTIERVHISRLDLALKVAFHALFAEDVLTFEKSHALGAFLVAEADFANKLAVVELKCPLIFVVICENLSRTCQFDGSFVVVDVVTGISLCGVRFGLTVHLECCLTIEWYLKEAEQIVGEKRDPSEQDGQTLVLLPQFVKFSAELVELEEAEKN